jgi:peptide/nickel transport system substrate-binding protein
MGMSDFVWFKGINRMRRGLVASLVGTSLAALLPTPSLAQGTSLTVALSTPVSTLDPHFHNLTPNNGMARHVFEALVNTDDAQRPFPGLAESWRALSDTEWEFKLRKGVKFHDGSDFTAADVLATFERVPKVPNSPASFAVFVRAIAEAKALDSHTSSAAADRSCFGIHSSEGNGRNGQDRRLQFRQGHGGYRRLSLC